MAILNQFYRRYLQPASQNDKKSSRFPDADRPGFFPPSVGPFKSVLIVDDQEINQIILYNWLKKLGFSAIDTAENGYDALDHMRMHEYDLVFMDCQMPHLSGYKTTQIIRDTERNSDRHTLVIAVTANNTPENIEKCVACGMDGFIEKPLNSLNVVKIVETYLNPHKETSENFAASKTTLDKEDALLNKTPVNLERLIDFTEGNKAIEQSVIKLFIDKAGESITTMAKHISPNHSGLWMEACHNLKGTSGNIGAEKLYHLCLTAERLTDERTHGRKEILEQIKGEFKNVREYLLTL